MIYSENDYRDYLEHHGILGMRWGVRRYQNKDGSLTSSGKKHYSSKNALAKDKDRHRLVDDGNPNVVGVRQKNGDILFVSRQDAEKYGIKGAEKKTQDYIKERTKNSSVKKEKSFDYVIAKEEQKAEKAAEREKILNDPKLLKKHFNEYSDKEINDALKKFDQMQRLDTHSNNRSSAKRVLKALGTTVGVANTIKSSYELYKYFKNIKG